MSIQLVGAVFQPRITSILAKFIATEKPLPRIN